MRASSSRTGKGACEEVCTVTDLSSTVGDGAVGLHGIVEERREGVKRSSMTWAASRKACSGSPWTKWVPPQLLRP